MAATEGSPPGRPYRFLLSRRWAGLLLVALLVATACVLLGRWQLHRLGERHERNHLLERNLDAPPAAPQDLLRVGRDPRPDDIYARVRATGRYDVGRQLLVRTRPLDGQVGYYALTPLVTGQGPAVLLVRGWVPDGPTAESLPDVPPPPDGTVTVTARIRPSEDPSTTGTPPRGQVTRIDVPRIARTLPYDVYGGYGEVTAERPTRRTTPTRLPAPEPSEGPHLAYAFQWFLFAGLALGGYVVLARREEADRRGVTAPPDRVGVPR
jgi:cytochrome oxidase assembly protein ShyY1